MSLCLDGEWGALRIVRSLIDHGRSRQGTPVSSIPGTYIHGPPLLVLTVEPLSPVSRVQIKDLVSDSLRSKKVK